MGETEEEVGVGAGDEVGEGSILRVVMLFRFDWQADRMNKTINRACGKPGLTFNMGF